MNPSKPCLTISHPAALIDALLVFLRGVWSLHPGRCAVLLLFFITMTLAIAVPHSLIRGLPQQGEWPLRLMVYLGLPALFVAFYAIFSTLGQHRIRQVLDETEVDGADDRARAMEARDTKEASHE